MTIDFIHAYLHSEFENEVDSSIKADFIAWLKNAKNNANAFLNNISDGNYKINFPEDGMLICNIASDIKGGRVNKKKYTDIFNVMDYSLLDDSFSHELFEDAIKDNDYLHFFCDCKLEETKSKKYIRVITVSNFISYYPNCAKGITPSYTSKDADKVFKILEQPNNEFCNKEYRFTADPVRNLIWVADKEEFDLRKKQYGESDNLFPSFLVNCLGLPMPASQNNLIYFIYPETFFPEMHLPICLNARWGNNEVFYLSYSCKDNENWGRTRTYKGDYPDQRMKERVHRGGGKDDYFLCSPHVLGIGEYSAKGRDGIINDALNRFANI